MDRRLIRGPAAGTAPRLRWAALVGLMLGAAMAGVLTLPASWLGGWVANMTQHRVLLLQPQGTLWRGAATLALGAGPGSPSSVALPQRLRWQLSPAGAWDAPWRWRLRLDHSGILNDPVTFLIQPGWGQMAVSLDPASQPAGAVAQMPASWLSGLGAPWNTLQPQGRVTLQIEHLQWEASRRAPPQLSLGLKVRMQNIASRVTTLPVLGHYELAISGGPALTIGLSTKPGSALVLEGQGRWTPGGRVEFRGQATAAPGREEALSNLLNIIGRRDGARSLISL